MDRNVRKCHVCRRTLKQPENWEIMNRNDRNCHVCRRTLKQLENRELINRKSKNVQMTLKARKNQSLNHWKEKQMRRHTEKKTLRKITNTVRQRSEKNRAQHYRRNSTFHGKKIDQQRCNRLYRHKLRKTWKRLFVNVDQLNEKGIDLTLNVFICVSDFHYQHKSAV